MNQIIKFFVTLENVVGFYRNYMCFNKLTKSLALVRILFEISILFLSILYQKPQNKYEHAHYLMTSLFSFVIAIIALYNSKKFKEILALFGTASAFFPNARISDSIKMKFRVKVIIGFLIWYALVHLSGSIIFVHMFEKKDERDLPMFMYFCFNMENFLSDFRFMLEFGVVWSIYISISDQINCIIKAINDEISYKQVQNLTGAKTCISVYRSVKFLDKLSEAYEVIEKIANLCNNMFYLQVSL